MDTIEASTLENMEDMRVTSMTQAFISLLEFVSTKSTNIMQITNTVLMASWQVLLIRSGSS